MALYWSRLVGSIATIVFFVFRFLSCDGIRWCFFFIAYLIVFTHLCVCVFVLLAGILCQFCCALGRFKLANSSILPYINTVIQHIKTEFYFHFQCLVIFLSLALSRMVWYGIYLRFHAFCWHCLPKEWRMNIKHWSVIILPFFRSFSSLL